MAIFRAEWPAHGQSGQVERKVAAQPSARLSVDRRSGHVGAEPTAGLGGRLRRNRWSCGAGWPTPAGTQQHHLSVPAEHGHSLSKVAARWSEWSADQPVPGRAIPGGRAERVPRSPGRRRPQPERREVRSRPFGGNGEPLPRPRGVVRMGFRGQSRPRLRTLPRSRGGPPPSRSPPSAPEWLSGPSSGLSGADRWLLPR
jgi:hypothetical protein